MGIVIAIDGPSGAGKSTVARRLAERLGFKYIDSGAMYRAVALWALREKLNPSDMHRMEQLARAASIQLGQGTVRLNGEDVTKEIRVPEVSAVASVIAAIPGVRRALVEKQRELAANSNVVMEGRDIGSVVCPQAEVKIFLDAEPEERARRRYQEIRGSHPSQRADVVAAEMDQRDQRDRTRVEAPLTQAPDAILVDSSSLTIEQVEETILKLVRDRISNGKAFH